MEQEYTITLTKTQLIIVEKALEEFLRLRMGQCTDFALDMAELGVGNPFDVKDPRHKEKFDDYLSRRDKIELFMKEVFKVSFAPEAFLRSKTDEMLVAEDMWSEIRQTMDEADGGKSCGLAQNQF